MFEIALGIYIVYMLLKKDLNISKTLDLGRKEARGEIPSLSSVTTKTGLPLCLNHLHCRAGGSRLANLGHLITGDLTSQAHSLCNCGGSPRGLCLVQATSNWPQSPGKLFPT